MKTEAKAKKQEPEASPCAALLGGMLPRNIGFVAAPGHDHTRLCEPSLFTSAFCPLRSDFSLLPFPFCLSYENSGLSASV